jgi:hypothetical protein
MNFHLASAPKYPDETAVHFAAQLVADGYYGGESGNEIFFVYPSDTLASQHNFAFNGWEKDFTQPQSETKWNDVFVWPNTLDNPGIPVDAGFVFLPESAQVDPQTGSKYASEVKIVDGEEKRVMIEDTNLVNSFVEWGKKLDEQSVVKQAFKVYKDERNYFYQEERRNSCLVTFAQELQKLGFTQDASAALGDKLMSEMHWRDELTDEVLQHIIKESGAQWKRAVNTIPSKDYWEDFFVKNPNFRPKHIQYYDGSPTRGIVEFLQKNNIGRADTSESQGKLLGFDDHHILLNEGLGGGDMDAKQDSRVMVGYKELVDTANKIIAEHYSQKVEESVGE